MRELKFRRLIRQKSQIALSTIRIANAEVVRIANWNMRTRQNSATGALFARVKACGSPIKIAPAALAKIRRHRQLSKPSHTAQF